MDGRPLLTPTDRPTPPLFGHTDDRGCERRPWRIEDGTGGGRVAVKKGRRRRVEAGNDPKERGGESSLLPKAPPPSTDPVPPPPPPPPVCLSISLSHPCLLGCLPFPSSASLSFWSLGPSFLPVGGSTPSRIKRGPFRPSSSSSSSILLVPSSSHPIHSGALRTHPTIRLPFSVSISAVSLPSRIPSLRG